MKSLPFGISRPKAFTLIELLVVIAIIAVLMAMLFPVVQTVKESSRKATARHAMAEIQGGLKNYYTEYGMYPVTDVQASAGQVGYDTVYGDPNGLYSNDKLFDILRNNTTGPNSALVASRNPRGCVFMDIPAVKDPTRPKAGIATAGATASNGDTINPGAFVDPWGFQYVVFIDANYDGTITSNGAGNSGGGGPYWFYSPYNGTISLSTGACSLGKDGKWGKAGNGQINDSDDVVSW